MAHRLLRDRDAEGWEKAEFPIVCETCLGPNPYLRMTRAEYDKECKICTRPFTVFRWRPGADARFKKTEICQTCARAKNVCQTCVLDLDYQVPVQVRDHALGQEAQLLPKSDINREYFVQNLEKQIASGEFDAQNKGKVARPSEVLSQLQRSGPMYSRNKAKICSFFVKGCCTRGAECPFRHELPQEVHKDESLAKQNIKDRYHGVNDPVAAKMLSKARKMPSLKEFPEDRYEKLPSPHQPSHLLSSFLVPKATYSLSLSLFPSNFSLFLLKFLRTGPFAHFTWAAFQKA